MNKIVDAIIPVYRPGNEFRELLRRLSNQSYPLNKIILMNTGDAPWRAEIEKEFPLCEIHLLKKENFDYRERNTFGRGCTRNFAGNRIYIIRNRSR